MKSFKEFLCEAFHGHGWITPEGKVHKSPFWNAHTRLAQEAGYKGQFHALENGAIRFSQDRGGTHMEVHKDHIHHLVNHMSKLEHLASGKGDYSVDIVHTKPEYDIVDSSTHDDLGSAARYLRSKIGK